MATQVEICNAALVRLAGTTINSIDEASAEANACKVLWDSTRKSELRKHPWNFAIKRNELVRSPAEPIYKYQYKYSIPPECLRLIENYMDFDYKIEGSYIYTNESKVYVRYVYDVTDTSKWDPLFVDVMTAAMSYKLAYAIPRSGAMIDRMRSEYNDVWMIATHVDSSEDTPDQWNQGLNPYINTRF